MTFLINNIILSAFNFLNSRIDAYRIKVLKKVIRHAINFGAYALLVAFLIWRQKPGWYEAINFCISAFCNRQFTFDIPLNVRRGLKWDYVSLDKPPKAVLDKIEICLFGYNGRAPFLMYGVVFIICLLVKFFWL